MDRFLRILQRQLYNEVDLISLPPVLQQYVANIERLAGVGSVFSLEYEDHEKEIDLRAAFMEYGGTPGLAGTVASRVIRHLNRLDLPPTLEGLVSANPLELARIGGMGYRSMAVVGEVLAAMGLLNPEWMDFILRNKLYLEGRDKTPRRNPYRRNADTELRKLERTWKSTRSDEAWNAYLTAIARMGLEMCDECDAVVEKQKISECKCATPICSSCGIKCDNCEELRCPECAIVCEGCKHKHILCDWECNEDEFMRKCNECEKWYCTQCDDDCFREHEEDCYY